MFNATSWWTHAHIINLEQEFIFVCAHSYQNFSTLLNCYTSLVLSDLNLVWSLRLFGKTLMRICFVLYWRMLPPLWFQKYSTDHLKISTTSYTFFRLFTRSHLNCLKLRSACPSRVSSASDTWKDGKAFPTRFKRRRMVACRSEAHFFFHPKCYVTRVAP